MSSDLVLDGCKRAEILKHFLGELRPEEVVEYGNRKDELLQKHADAGPADAGCG